MFRSAALKLAVGYLAIMLVVSVSLSMVIYRLSLNELQRSWSRQVTAFNPFGPFPFDLDQLRENELLDSQHHLRANLIVFNLAVAVAGGGLSYYLARRTLKPIQDAMENQARFTADASHELRTPLTVMQSGIEVALRDKNMTKDDAVEMLKSNLEEVGKLKTLSNSLLQLTRHDAEVVPMQPVALRAAIREAVDRQTEAAQAKSITVTTDLPAITVLADQPSLVELVAILLDNAIKYSPENTTITIVATDSGKQVTITVTDRGFGIRPEHLPHIFKRLYRVEPPGVTAKTLGYGLGLSIAQTIARLHHTTIEVQSTPGQGSTFSFVLSKADASADSQSVEIS